MACNSIAGIIILKVGTKMLTVNDLGCNFCFTLQAIPVIMESSEAYGVMTMFSLSCFIGMVVSVVFLPETNGKNLNKKV